MLLLPTSTFTGDVTLVLAWSHDLFQFIVQPSVLLFPKYCDFYSTSFSSAAMLGF